MHNFVVINKKIKKILIPLDGSKTSFKGLEMAIYIARQCEATITGIHVVPIYPRNLGDAMTPIRDRLLTDTNKFLNKARVISAQNGIVFNRKIIYGDAKNEISDFARDNKIDLIVIGSRGLGSVKEMFLGSVSNATVHKSHVPVLVVR